SPSCPCSRFFGSPSRASRSNSIVADNAKRAEQLRKHGNGLYLAGQLFEAMKVYQDAADLVKDDPTPRANLSAANFEAGQYSKCIENVQTALNIMQSLPGAEAIPPKKLLVRLAKANLHLSRLDQVADVLEKLEPCGDRDDLLNALQDARGSADLGLSQSALWELLLRMPRLKASIQDEPDFFGPGHDTAESLYTPSLVKTCQGAPTLAFMLCGVGDARHLFYTICDYAERLTGTQSQQIHFTILDHKPAVMARNLVFLALLNDAIADENSLEEIALTFAYLFCAHLVPPFVWKRLHSGSLPFSWAHLPASHMAAISRVLGDWRQDVARRYPTPRIRRAIRWALTRTRMQARGIGAEGEYLPKFKLDHEFFDNFSVMIPPRSALVNLEPEIPKLMSKHRKEGGDALKRQIERHFDENWRMNATLIDADWEAKKEDENELPDLGSDPFATITCRLKDDNAIMLLCAFFVRTLQAIERLQGSLKIEMLVGDMAEAMERVRHGLLDRPEQKQPSWPLEYHVVHMSNIPDYVGGSLTSFLYASPILKAGRGTGLMSTVLRNPPQWKSIDQFNAEHLLMYDRHQLQKHFGVKLSAETPEESSSSPMDLLMGPMPPLLQYKKWEKCSARQLSVEELLPKSRFSKWVYAHFLKTVLPFPRPQSDFALVYAPLNMTVVMRLLALAAELGYPDHWISTIINGLGTGRIDTTARAPRKYVLTPGALDKQNDSRTMSVQPWAAEFTTLITMWRGVLPCKGLFIPNKILPSPETISEYTIDFPPFQGQDLNVPHFALVFWNQRKYDEPPTKLRPLLQDDEKGDTTTGSQALRADGIRVLTTLQWTRASNRATFWLRSDVADQMMAEGWTVYIWRMDSWVRLTKALQLTGAMTRTRSWVDCVRSQQ
ncbi:hypothetical protein F4780DRAFT_792580, partial [Xylariomycetidae sp. FL0641]